jgi:hypothetical protein
MPTGACVIDILKLVYVHYIHNKFIYLNSLLSSLYPVGIPADMVSAGGQGKQVTGQSCE